MQRQMLFTTVLLCAGFAGPGARLAGAGDLNPPEGPIQPTMKTLTDVEPRTAVNVATAPGDEDSLFRIAVPGSYYLTGNILGESGKSGIEIAADGVSLDLNGFELLGVAGSLDGVCAPSTVNDVAVRNGILKSWGQAGLNLLNATGGRIAGIRSASNASFGIGVRDGFSIADCTADSNGSHGIRVRWQCTITHCTSNSSGTGTGILTEAHDTVIGCTANYNAADGISGGEGCVIKDCTANQNQSDGIRSYSCASIANCAAYSNSGDGIDAGVASTVTNCTTMFNDRNGIYAQNDCLVLSNMCKLNDEEGMAGIRLGYHNRAEGNHVSSNAIGIRAGQDDDNLIIKNSADGNAINYDIGAGNHCGQIISNPGFGFASGNPWANFDIH